MNICVVRDYLSDVARNPWRGFLRTLDILAHGTKTARLQREWQNARTEIIRWPDDKCALYKEEISCLRDSMEYCMLPYAYPSRVKFAIRASRDYTCNCPYVIHRGKRLYFHGDFTNCMAENSYIDLTASEGVLGSGMRRRSPHSYVNANHRVEQGDILLDVGCAEAIFALDNIEKVAKAYLFESEHVWRKPLRLTFEPYADKTVIINKLVSDKTTRKSTRLVDAVVDEMSNDAHFFVKMDIEGWERTVINGNVDFFKNAKVKLSCCVYHRQDDAQVIEKMLKDMGYKTRFSEGWMLPTMNGIHYPYFRHGVIYAKNY